MRALVTRLGGFSRRAAIGLLLGGCLLALTPGVASAATINVTRTDDPSGSGDCTTTDTSCSLRQAINAASAGDAVSVPSGTYQLTQANSLTIGTSITLSGAGARTTTIESTSTGPGSIFIVASGVTATIQGV